MIRFEREGGTLVVLDVESGARFVLFAADDSADALVEFGEGGPLLDAEDLRELLGGACAADAIGAAR